jgi:hypothetical protein
MKIMGPQVGGSFPERDGAFKKKTPSKQRWTEGKTIAKECAHNKCSG